MRASCASESLPDEIASEIETIGQEFLDYVKDGMLIEVLEDLDDVQDVYCNLKED